MWNWLSLVFRHLKVFFSGYNYKTDKLLINIVHKNQPMKLFFTKNVSLTVKVFTITVKKVFIKYGFLDYLDSLEIRLHFIDQCYF